MAESMRFVGPLERALFLKSSPQFEGLPAGSVPSLAEMGVERRFRKGAGLLRAGEPAASFHLVVEGAITVVGAQDPQPIAVGPRETAGLLSLLARAPEGVEANAHEDALTLEFEGGAFRELLEDDMDLLLTLVRWLARRTLNARREIAAGSFLSPGIDLPPGSPQGTDLVGRVLRMRRRGATFERTSLEGLVDFARRIEEVRIPAGTTIWSSGDASNTSYILFSGTVHCTTQWSLVPFRCGPGYPLGNLERLGEEPRWYTAVAETDVVAFRSDLDTFFDVLEDQPQMGRNVISSMASNLIRILREQAGAPGLEDAIPGTSESAEAASPPPAPSPR